MYDKTAVSRMVFIDIETTYINYNETTPEQKEAFKNLLEKKFSSGEYKDLNDDEENFKHYSTLNPEYSRISCIVIGAYNIKTQKITTKVFTNQDEKELLLEFSKALEQIYDKNHFVNLVGHYIRYFDIPFIIKRMLANDIIPHRVLHLHKQKPWETQLIDTYDVYKFGGMKSGSLEDMAILLGVPSPKSKYKSADAPELFHTNLDDLLEYCQNDVITNIKVVLKMSQLEWID